MPTTKTQLSNANLLADAALQMLRDLLHLSCMRLAEMCALQGIVEVLPGAGCFLSSDLQLCGHGLNLRL
jgi:hypothetical protein